MKRLRHKNLLFLVECVFVLNNVCTVKCSEEEYFSDVATIDGGYQCKEGYVRDDNNICVPTPECLEDIQCGYNEIYDLCPPQCPGENCGVNPSVILCLPNPAPGDPACTPGCRCQDNYFRNDYGFCVTKEQCPKCDGPHEYFSCGAACDNVCATLKTQNQTNCPIINKKCNPKCYCQEGYARDDKNICIPIKKCPPPACGINEVYDTCIASCPPRRCDVDENIIRCARPPQPGDPACQSGCRCADNFYRNDEGVCVPKSECPPKCGLNEVYDRNIPPCPPQSCDVDPRLILCPPDQDGQPGCRCINNYFRNREGVCIPKEQCEKCPKNERPTSCFQAKCERRNCSDLTKAVACVRIDPKFCTDGCLCDDGYLRAKNGTCVPINECPEAKCGDNEVFDSCPSTCPGEKCGVDPTTIQCLPGPEPGDPSCQPKCICADGYLRNNDGKCVPKDKCPKPPRVICGADEDYNSCVNGGCGRWKCSQPGIICIDLIEGAFQEGCRCKKGLLRAINGSCIPADKCPLNCYGENEVSGCKSTCPQTCESIGKKYSCPLQPAECTPECCCKEGFFRNKLNECISKDDCLKCTGPNEYFSCGGACDNVCATLAVQNQTICPINNIVCNKMCYCEKGYARDVNNICVPISECPQPVCGINEIFDECPATCPPRTCDALTRAYKCKPPPKSGDPECKPGCRCADGHYRNEKGVCVLRTECLNCLGQNEVRGCRSVTPQTCESIGKNKIQPRISVCIPECRCKEGYFRNKINQCISTEDCLKCTGPNEYFSCGGACDNVCATLAVQNQTICPIVNVVCNKMCYCEKGYARDDNKVCVPISECPQQKCPKNERPTSCIQAKCERRNCSDLMKPVSCVRIDPKFCTDGCLCDDGYLRAKNGTCVPINECPAVCGINEIFDDCPATCPPRTCDALTRAYKCKPPPKSGDPECKPGCRCADSHYRNEKGVCVLRTECLNCLGQNEVRGCRSVTPQTCESIGKNKIQPRISVCIPECRCKEGYFRNKINQCISTEDCLKCTGPNEYFSCGGACDNVCATLAVQNQTICPIVNVVCNKMCYCEKGYARDDNKVCVPISECPQQKCPKNERPTSCIQAKCERRKCSDLMKPVACVRIDPKFCTDGCLCDDGYLRAKNGTCVPINECPAVCGINEIFDDCPATCPPRTCDALTRAYKCKPPPKSGDPECKPGCRCADGHYRNEKGVCVLRTECLNCLGQNEVRGCRSVSPQTCESIGKNKIQTRISVCIPECRCKEGYFRNKINQCISTEDCLKCTGPNEYFSCGGACDNVCATLAVQNQTICPIVNVVCNKMCYCEKGYARDDNKVCVPISECPQHNQTNNALKEFEKGNVAFTEKFLYEAAKAKPGVSLIFSPFSVLFLLAQLVLYAKGYLLEQLLRILNLGSKSEIRSFIPKYLDTLGAQQNVTFDLVEKIFATIKLELSEDFQRDAKDVMKAEAQSLDFCKSSEAAEIINQWVALKTKNLIKNLVSPGSLDCNTVLVLTNAIYFKGDWKDKFDEKNTMLRDFYVNEKKTVQVNMMSRTGSYKYAEISDLDAQVIVMPYQSDNFSFLMWLPNNKINGIYYMLDKIRYSNYSLDSVISDMKKRPVDLSMPVFNSTTTTDLKDILNKANAGALFEVKNSGLTGIFKHPVPTYVSSATQKATVTVNESGSEAAAANALVVSATSAQVNRRTQFIANHPFIYYILYKGTPIFCGIYFADA